MKWATSVISKCKWCTSHRMDPLKMHRCLCRRRIKWERTVSVIWIRWISIRIMQQAASRIRRWAPTTCRSPSVQSSAKDSLSTLTASAWLIITSRKRPTSRTTTWRACVHPGTSGTVQIKLLLAQAIIMIQIGPSITPKATYSRSAPARTTIGSCKTSGRINK